MSTLVSGGCSWAFRGSLNTAMPYVCSRSWVVTTWSSFRNKLTELAIRRGWHRNTAQVNLRTGGVGKLWQLICVKMPLIDLSSENRSKSELPTFNTDFTFELFICAAILLDNRESLLQCHDDVQLIQFTSRFSQNSSQNNGCWRVLLVASTKKRCDCLPHSHARRVHLHVCTREQQNN